MAQSSASADVVARLERLFADSDPIESVSFLGAQFDLGLAWVHAQPGFGGLGVDGSLQRVVDQRCRDGGAPASATGNPVGHGMAAPTLLAHGTDVQRQMLRPLFTGEEIWCQLFSEPDAGSDLANLATRATEDGDHWIITGQKVWTTLARQARWGLLAARTDPDAPKHAGITYFIVDMNAPGVEVRPLHQITGEAEFNEVYLSEVRVADVARLGAVGDGWNVIMTTLTSERGVIGGRTPRRGGGFIGEAVTMWERCERRTPQMRDRLAKLWTEAETLRLTNIRAAHQRAAGSVGPESSMGKVAAASLNQRISEFCVDLMGADGLLYPDGYVMERPAVARLWKSPQHAFLRARANSIEGGSSEIARNVVAERVLGLPREPSQDRKLPWSETRRGVVR